MKAAQRGDVWLAKLDPTHGHEQRGEQPVLVLSADIFNQGPTRLVVVAPLTTTRRVGATLHVEVEPPDGGVRRVSFVMCEQLRAVSVDRLGPQPFGLVSGAVMRTVEDRLRVLLDL